MLIYRRVTISPSRKCTMTGVWHCLEDHPTERVSRFPGCVGPIGHRLQQPWRRKMLDHCRQYYERFRCMMIYDDIWWYMVIHGDLWWYMMIFKGCRPCRRPRKRESWLHSSVLWVVSLDALYIHYIYMHQIVYTCVLNWNFASPYPCHEAQASILLLSVFRGWCVLLPVRET